MDNEKPDFGYWQGARDYSCSHGAFRSAEKGEIFTVIGISHNVSTACHRSE